MGINVTKDGVLEIGQHALAGIYERGFVCNGCSKYGTNLIEIAFLDCDISLCPDCLRNIADIVEQWRESEAADG